MDDAAQDETPAPTTEAPAPYTPEELRRSLWDHLAYEMTTGNLRYRPEVRPAPRRPTRYQGTKPR